VLIQEIDMSKHGADVSMRERFEKVFAAVASAAIVAFVAIGTFSMCGIGPMIA
jgi:hypothetical protein